MPGLKNAFSETSPPPPEKVERLTRDLKRTLFPQRAYTGEKYPRQKIASLIAQGADVTQIEGAARAAVQHNDKKLLSHIIEKGGDISEPELLSQSAWIKDGEIMHMLLAAGVDIESADPQIRRTALMEACQGGSEENALDLLLMGADKKRKDHLGRNAMDHAEFEGNKRVIEILEMSNDERMAYKKEKIRARIAATEDALKATTERLYALKAELYALDPAERDAPPVKEGFRVMRPLAPKKPVQL